MKVNLLNIRKAGKNFPNLEFINLQQQLKVHSAERAESVRLRQFNYSERKTADTNLHESCKINKTEIKLDTNVWSVHYKCIGSILPLHWNCTI